MTNETIALIAAIRGALLRFTPAPTLCVDEARRHDESAVREPFVVRSKSDGPPTGAQLVAALETYVEQTGGVPRRIVVDSDTELVVGSTLSVADERGREPMLAACSGRENVVRGRIAVVTGGAQGFGEELVRSLVDHGALVFVADLNLDGAVALCDELNAHHGPRTRAIHVDISDEASVSAMLDAMVSFAGGVDLVLANAGVLRAGSVKELSRDDFDFVTRVNYGGFFLCTKHTARVMAAQNAAAPPDRFTDVVQINSKSGLSGSNRNGAYAGSKFGGIGLVQSFALELIADRVKVNAICPGNFFEGPLWSDPDRGLFVQYLRAGKVPGATSVADVRAHYEAQVPMGRGCRGGDVARALYYIVEQLYETGQAVPVTGGQIMLS